MSQIDETLGVVVRKVVQMNAHKKTPSQREEAGGLKNRLQLGLRCGRVIAIKAVAPAMTIQVYTNLIKRRNQIVSINALVSPKHCESVPLIGGSTSKKPNQSCCTNRVIPRTTRQPDWNHVDRGDLVHHPVDTMMERAVRMTGEKK